MAFYFRALLPGRIPLYLHLCIGTIGLVSLSYGLKLFLLLFQDILNLTEFFVVQKGKCASFFTEVAVNTVKNPLREDGSYSSPFFFLTPSTNFFANCWSSAAGIFSLFLSSSSLLRNSLNNFRSDTVFFFVLAFSWSSANYTISSSVNLTNLLLAIFIQGNVWQRLQDAYKFRREITEITSSINSRVRLWKINHSGPGCSFYEFYEWYIFQ